MNSAEEIGWFLNEWLLALRLKQRDLVTMTGWPKQKVSRLCKGTTPYNQEILETLGRALGVHPYELLLPPEMAKRVRAHMLTPSE